MKIFDSIKARFPSIFGNKQEQAWGTIAKVGNKFELYRGDGVSIGSFKRKWEAAHVAEREGLLLID